MLLEKVVKCTKELSSFLRQESTSMKEIFPLQEHYSCMDEQSLRMEVSSPLREQSLCMEEQPLIGEELTSQTQLEVSLQIFTCPWSFHLLHDINSISHLLTSFIMADLILVRVRGSSPWESHILCHCKSCLLHICYICPPVGATTCHSCGSGRILQGFIFDQFTKIVRCEMVSPNWFWMHSTNW